MADTKMSPEDLFELGRKNYESLVAYCDRLERGGLWNQARNVMKQSSKEVLDLYVQSVMLSLASVHGPVGQAQQEYVLNITNTNPLEIPVRDEIKEETVQYGQKTAKMPPILIQLCGVYDRQADAGTHMAVDFLDSMINVMLCMVDMVDREDKEAQEFIKNFYHQVIMFVQSADGHVAGDEAYILYKLQTRPIKSGVKWLLKPEEPVIKKKGSTEKKQVQRDEAAGKPVQTAAAADTVNAPEQISTGTVQDAGDGAGNVAQLSGIQQAEGHRGKKKTGKSAKRKKINVEETERLLRQEMKRQEKERIKEEKRRAEELKRKAEEEEKRRLEEEHARLAEEQRRIEEEQRRLEEEQQLAKEEFQKVKKRLMEREKAEREEQEQRVGVLLAELNELVGLESVKEEIRSLINLITIRKMREKMNVPAMDMSYHMVFTGSPGTGKTTVARLVAKIYKELGILSEGQLVETDRSRLVAGYVGQTAINVREIVEQAIGGVLFIDEAYSLVSPDTANDYGSEAIDTLVKMMEDHRDDLVVIVAGYTEEMKVFLKSNSGLISRFNKFIAFEDYTSEQLLEILKVMVERAGLSVEEEAVDAVGERLVEMSPDEKKDFGNARGVRNIFEKMVMNQANRLVEVDMPSKSQLMTLTREDVHGLTA